MLRDNGADTPLLELGEQRTVPANDDGGVMSVRSYGCGEIADVYLDPAHRVGPGDNVGNVHRY
jgi:hypothetical protein